MAEKRNQLRAARELLGLSQDAAARLTGISDSLIGDFEKGKRGDRGASKGRLLQLCRAYHTRAEELGWDPAPFHESVLCPGEFPPPKKAGDPEPVRSAE